jgi:phosphatidylserine/phosphatidylglycerophosphate/cardiolipin synthase-like enzyme
MRAALNCCLAVIALGFACANAPEAVARSTTLTAFSPSPETTTLITSNIAEAQESIRIAAYSFTSQPVADALIAAHEKGVDVMAVVDKSNQYRRTHSIISQLHEAGIPVRVDRMHSIMHDKYIVIDGRTLETGSFNYTANAEKHNAENVMVIKDKPSLARTYLKDWQRLWDESDDYSVGAADEQDIEN